LLVSVGHDGGAGQGGTSRKRTGEVVSGELGLAGYRFQYHVIVLTALELWTGADDHGVDTIVVEGRPGAEKVDFELIGRSSTDGVVVQVKSRWGARAWSPFELLDLLMSLSENAHEPVRLELVANGTFSKPAQRFIDLLGSVEKLDDEELTQSLAQLSIGRGINAVGLAAVRRARVVVRPGGLSELRDRVRTHLRIVRADIGHGIGGVAAELLRAYLLGLAMDKAEADDVEGRTLRRDEFLEAIATSRDSLEQALASRWGVPVLLTYRAHSVRRPELEDRLAGLLTTDRGLHAVDGKIRSCVVAGPAGIGKTTLAQQYALANAAEFDWIYQLNAGDDDASADADVFGEALEQFAGWLDRRGVRIRRSQPRSRNTTMREVSEALAGSTQSWLLIVDNAISADLLAEVLPASGYGVVLITTRNSAWHGSQQVVRVGTLTPDQGRSLVKDRLADVSVTDDEAGALCEVLDRFPLSLMTAISYLRSTRQSVGAFLATLDDEVHRLTALDFPLQRLEDYPSTVVAAVNLALQRLRARADHHSVSALAILRRASVVLADRIPTTVLAADRQIFNSSAAVLAELSLMDRWQDQDGRDWVTMHRVIQDVTYAELVARPQDLRTVLGEVELAVTDTLRDCIRQVDLVTGGALRSHAVALAERLMRAGAQTWQTTTALLANAGTAAHMQGDFAEAQRLFNEALGLIPDGDHDPRIAGRRGKTLAALAVLQLEHDDVAAARSSLERARRAHDLHRLIPAHYEALIACTALQSVLDARDTVDEAVIRAQFDWVRSLSLSA
jgi:hypothetical protein